MVISHGQLELDTRRFFPRAKRESIDRAIPRRNEYDETWLGIQMCTWWRVKWQRSAGGPASASDTPAVNSRIHCSGCRSEGEHIRANIWWCWLIASTSLCVTLRSLSHLIFSWREPSTSIPFHGLLLLTVSRQPNWRTDPTVSIREVVRLAWHNVQHVGFRLFYVGRAVSHT